METMLTEYEAEPIPKTEGPALTFLYRTPPGRLLLKAVARPAVSRLAGAALNSRASAVLIERYRKRAGIELKEYKAVQYRSFNDFFTREIAPGNRPFPQDRQALAAPCDGRLTAYRLTADSCFTVKRQSYSVRDLLGGAACADRFTGGTAFIFRLVPRDYHRYCFIADGRITEHKKIEGVLHTVRPIAHQFVSVFAENSREYTVMQTEDGQTFIQVEVGAMMVGKIVNLKRDGMFKRGEEKGYFEFGGSTVLLFFEENAVEVDAAVDSNTAQGLETVVRQGQAIGRWKPKQEGR